MHPRSTDRSIDHRLDSVPSLHVIALIPARFASARFPGKPLALIDGRPMIEHVYRRAATSPSVAQVIVATDDLRIASAVQSFGGDVRMTRPDHLSGTDRLAEVAATLDCDIVVNVQGDEPLIDPQSIAEAVAPLVGDASLQMSTLYRRISTPAELADPNVVKIVVDRAGFALYFSRSPVPYVGNPRGGYPPLYRHVRAVRLSAQRAARARDARTDASRADGIARAAPRA